MSEFIDYLNNIINDLKNKINEISNNDDIGKYNNVISILNNIVEKSEFSEEELNLLKEVLEKITNDESFDQIDRTKVKFIITVLLPNKEKLDSSQIEVCKKIQEKVEEKKSKIEDANELEKIVEENERLIKKLKTGERFNDFEILGKKLIESDIEKNKKIDLLRNIIINNYKSALSLSNETNEIDIEYNNSEESIKVILSEFGYNYDNLNKKYKNLLMKYADLNNMRKVLQTLEKEKIFFKLNGDKISLKFTMILIKSKEEIIIGLKNDFLNNQLTLADFKDYVRNYPTVLYTSRIYKRINRPHPVEFQSESAIGTNKNFKENIEFFKSKELDIKKIFEESQSLFNSSPRIVKQNCEVLDKIYKVKLFDNKLSGLSNGTAITVVDRYIESDKDGYEYIINNLSRLNNYSEDDFYKMKSVKMQGGSLFKRVSKLNKREKFIRETAKKIDVKELDFQDSIKMTYDVVEKEFKIFDYIDEKILENKYIKMLDEKYIECEYDMDGKVIKKYDYVYLIGNTRVSRQKVLRVLMNFDACDMEIGENEVKYALGYKSILVEEDVNNINDFINSIKLGVKNNG